MTNTQQQPQPTHESLSSEPLTKERLRQALDDSVLTHTGRSIGDMASQRVVDDIWPLIMEREAQMRAVVQAVAAFDSNQQSIGAFWKLQAKAHAVLAASAESETAGEREASDAAH